MEKEGEKTQAEEEKMTLKMKTKMRLPEYLQWFEQEEKLILNEYSFAEKLGDINSAKDNSNALYELYFHDYKTCKKIIAEMTYDIKQHWNPIKKLNIIRNRKQLKKRVQMSLSNMEKMINQLLNGDKSSK